MPIVRHLAAAVDQVADQVVEPARIYPGLTLKASASYGDLVVEFLLHLTPNIAPGQDGEDFEQGRDR